MEGKNEVLELKARYLFEEEEFLQRLNQSFPPGIRALRLEKLEPYRASLTREISSLEYSLPLDDKAMIKVLERLRKEMNVPDMDDCFLTSALSKELWKEDSDGIIEKIRIDQQQKKMFLVLKFRPENIPRAQDIVAGMFGVEISNFLLTRERINIKYEAKE